MNFRFWYNSPVRTAEEHFSRVKALLAHQQTFDALEHAERAHHLEPGDPFYLSYYGLLHALERGRVADGIEMCQRALRDAPQAAELYLNLARVFLKGGFKSKAVTTLRQGLDVQPDNSTLRAEVQQMGLRRPPVFPSLGRNHFLNRWLGRLRHLFKGPITPEEATVLTRSA